MKYLFKTFKAGYPTIFPDDARVVEHIFAVLGNGIDLDENGFIEGNLQCTQAHVFGDPKPLTHIYPWTTTESIQPFRKYEGCADVGFKEAVAYFLECVKLTPDSVDGISKWKENLSIIEEVLLGGN